MSSYSPHFDGIGTEAPSRILSVSSKDEESVKNDHFESRPDENSKMTADYHDDGDTN